MRTVLRAELFKLRSTRTSLGLFGGILALVLFVVLLHGLALPVRNFAGTSKQLTVLFGWGEVLGALFAGLLGAMSVTGEIRHGTIRPTFLVTPDRVRVIAAKVGATALVGAAFGLVAGAVAVGVGTAALSARGINVRLDADDYALLIAGGVLATALWGAIGVGIGAIVRNQVPTLVGLCAWLLLVENLLVGDVAGVGAVGKLLPGAAGKAMTGQDPDALVSPAIGLALLVLYATTATVAGSLATTRRDVP